MTYLIQLFTFSFYWFYLRNYKFGLPDLIFEQAYSTGISADLTFEHTTARVALTNTVDPQKI